MASKPPPRPPAPSPSPSSTAAPVVKAASISQHSERGQKVGIYGTGGIGKTELVTLAKDVGKRVLIVDVDDGCRFLDVESRMPANWEELLGLLGDMEFLPDYNLVCVDSMTKAEEMAKEWMLANIPHEKGHYVTSIEGYGFGKGYTHLFETFLKLLNALDRIARAGIEVVHISHDCTANVPNPNGENFIRYEPRLQSGGTKGDASIRNRVKEWSDHLLFIGYDVRVTNDGKGKGAGTRAIYPLEMPTHQAKSRLLDRAIIYTRGDSTLWKQLFLGEA